MSGIEWRDIPGYEGLYAISIRGEIRTTRRKGSPGGLRKTQLNTGGYPCVSLCSNGVKKTHTVHTLMASAFLGPRPVGMQVRHLDGNPLNSRLENLRYGTLSENMQDCIDHGNNARLNKTHCPRGHAYEGENIYAAPSRTNTRGCRTCRGWTGLTAPRVKRIEITNETRREIARRHAAGASLYDLAGEYGRSTTGIRYILHRANAEMSDRSAA